MDGCKVVQVQPIFDVGAHVLGCFRHEIGLCVGLHVFFRVKEGSQEMIKAKIRITKVVAAVP